MALIAFFSAKGAPGATTTALLSAALWPRPALVVDCDPAGGDIALRLPDPDGRPLTTDLGMLTLLPLARRAVDPAGLLSHAQRVIGGAEVIAGLPGPEQAAAAGATPWSNLADAFAALSSHDVIADLGRLDPSSPAMPVLRAADIAVCVATTTLSNVVATRTRLAALQSELEVRQTDHPTSLGVVVRSQRRADVASAVSALTGQDRLLTHFGQIADDPRAAQMFDGHPISRPERTFLVRSGREMIENLQRLLDSKQPGYSSELVPSPQAMFPQPNWLTTEIPTVHVAASPVKAPGRRRAETHRRSRRG